MYDSLTNLNNKLMQSEGTKNTKITVLEAYSFKCESFGSIILKYEKEL